MQGLLWCHLVASVLTTPSSQAAITGEEVTGGSLFLVSLLKLDRCPEVGMGALQTFSEAG